MRVGGQNLRLLASKSLYLSNCAKIGPRLLLITNKKSYTGFRLAPNLMTLNDLERQNRGFYEFFWRFWSVTQVYHSQGGPMEVSLCDLDRQFGICISTQREHPNFQLNY